MHLISRMYYSCDLPYTWKLTLCIIFVDFVVCDLQNSLAVQLKGNLIHVRMLQLEISHVKITSCIQYLNGRPLRFCPNQANCQACVPVNVPLILN